MSALHPRWRIRVVGRQDGRSCAAAKSGEKSFEAPSTVGRNWRSRQKGLRVAVAHYNGATLWFPNMAAKTGISGMGPAHISARTFSPDNKIPGHQHARAGAAWLAVWPTTATVRMSGYPGPRALDCRGSAAGPRGLRPLGAPDTVIIWPFTSKDGPMGKEPADGLAARCRRAVSMVACHPKQDIMAAGYSDGTVLMIRLEDGAEILVRRERRPRPSRRSPGMPGARYSPSPRKMVTAGMLEL